MVFNPDASMSLFKEANPNTSQWSNGQWNVASLYQTALGREATPEERNYWARLIDTGQASAEDVRNQIMQSQEGQQYQATNPQQTNRTKIILDAFKNGTGLGNIAQSLFAQGFTPEEIIPTAAGYMRSQAASGRGVDVNTKETYWGNNVWMDQVKTSLQHGYDKFKNPTPAGPTPQERGQAFHQQWMQKQKPQQRGMLQQPPPTQAPTGMTMNQQISALQQPQGLRPSGLFSSTNMPKRW